MKIKIEGKLILELNKEREYSDRFYVKYKIYQIEKDENYFSKFLCNNHQFKTKSVLIKEDILLLSSSRVDFQGKFDKLVKKYLEYPYLIKEELEKQIMKQYQKEYDVDNDLRFEQVANLNKQGLFNFEMEINLNDTQKFDSEVQR